MKKEGFFIDEKYLEKQREQRRIKRNSILLNANEKKLNQDLNISNIS